MRHTFLVFINMHAKVDSIKTIINGKFSKWSDVISIDSGINGCILKIADDTKLFNCVGSPGDIACPRNNLLKLRHWSTEWLMLFNVDKCQVMHFRYNNPSFSYYIDNTLLPTCTVEQDLGILIQDNLKVAEQCNKAADTANSISYD